MKAGAAICRVSKGTVEKVRRVLATEPPSHRHAKRAEQEQEQEGARY
jgi:hypothetical protein